MRVFAHVLSSVPRLTAVFAVAATAAGGAAYYSFFVAQQARYIEGRNFRLLGALAAQTEGAIESEARRFQTLADEPKRETWNYLRTRRYRDADLPKTLPDMTRPEAAYTLLADDGRFFVGITLTDQAHATVTAQHPEAVDPWAAPTAASAPTFRIPLALIVDPIFKPKLAQSAFDTVGLATQDGTTWFAAGPHAAELLGSRLDALVRPAAHDAAAGPFAEIVQSRVLDLTIGGAGYRLFAQPCCAFAGNAKGMMVIGLVEADEFRTQSWAISATVVKAATLIILLALVLWPFIKLACLGARQRVRRFDAFQIAASSVAALALLAVSGLDAYACWRLREDADVHLETLATAIATNFQGEMKDAVAQLSCLEQLDVSDPWTFGDLLAQPVRVERGPAASGMKCQGEVRELPPPSAPDIVTSNAVNVIAAPDVVHATNAANVEATALPDWPYSYFESFARIGPDDRQEFKLATTRWVQSRAQVRTRRYVTDVRDRKEWIDERLCPKGCVLESLWAWTSGEPQAVLSRRAERNMIQHPGAPAPPPGSTRAPDEIVTLALYLPSVIRPVLPPGFEFAVIDDAGAVWFHSDRYRNAYENFFAETDNNRRLRAQVQAHSAESLDLQYWGASYRAFVRPVGPFGLSVVTLFQRENVQALDREWLIVAMLLLAVYLAWWTIALVLALAPGAAWAWPDPARRTRYFAVSGLLLVVLIVAIGVAARVHGASLLWWAFGLPSLAWVATFALLRIRPSTFHAASAASARPASSREPVAAYATAAILFLLVSAVVPGVLLFTASFQLHVQSYIKRSHFQLVRALVARDARLRQEYSEDRGQARNTLIADRLRRSPIDQYYTFFYTTAVSPKPLEASDVTATSEDALIGALEEYLPYYAEASVEWRELLHAHAGDQSWLSDLTDDGVLTMTVTAGSRQTPRVTLRSSMPTLIAVPRDAGRPATRAAVVLDRIPSCEQSGVLLLALLLIGAPCGMVWFITRHLFLSGVATCVRRSARLTDGGGSKLFILCDAATRLRPMLGATRLPLDSLARQEVPEAAPAAALTDALAALDRDTPGAAVLIDDLDTTCEDAALMTRKLALLEQIASDATRGVIVLSEVAPSVLACGASRAFDAFVLVDWRDADPVTTAAADAVGPTSSSRTSRHLALLDRLLTDEGRGHVWAREVCERIQLSAAVRTGEPTAQQVLEEIAQQTAPCYRRIWESCSEDEQLVLGYVASDGWVHASARPVVRRLLGRRLLEKDPALRLMNGTFRAFVLSSHCRADVSRLESSAGTSTWDQLRLPLGVCVVGAAVFLFATQRELYNAILGLTTTAAVSVPSLIKAVGMLAGRRLPDDGGAAKA